MDILTVEEYLLIEKKDKSGIAISIQEIPDFSFETCSCIIEEDKIVFEPEMYSSNYIVHVPFTKEKHHEMVDSYSGITVAQIKKDSSFGGIFEMKISR